MNAAAGMRRVVDDADAEGWSTACATGLGRVRGHVPGGDHDRAEKQQVIVQERLLVERD